MATPVLFWEAVNQYRLAWFVYFQAGEAPLRRCLLDCPPHDVVSHRILIQAGMSKGRLVGLEEPQPEAVTSSATPKETLVEGSAPWRLVSVVLAV
jgi:hypothetical protein